MVMKNCTSKLLVSLSLVYMVFPASISSSEKPKNKRSLLLDNVLRNRFRWMNLHKATNKRSAFDALDLDKLLNDPIFHEAEEEDNMGKMDYNEMDFYNFPDYTDIPPVEKDEMSNVIPGSQGPFDFQPIKSGHESNHPYNFDSSAPSPAFQENAHAHYIAESLMDEFMQFLAMKEMGMLDQCLGPTKRR